jgi:terminase large subunit-like protein
MGGCLGNGVRHREIAYRPLPSQLTFHQCGAAFKGFSGPVGSGKSQALCQEAIRLAYINSGRLGLLGAPTYPMLRDVTQATIFEILESNHLPYEFTKAENLLTLSDCRSRIVFRAVDDFERLRGTNLAWFGLDELTYSPEEAWLRLEARLRDPKAKRLCGFAVWTPRGFDWVYKKFIAEPVEGYRVTLARPFENHFLLEKVPEFYKRLQHSYDEEFYRQEVLGEYLNQQGGLVYHAFDRREHVTDLRVEPGEKLLWTLDFNVNPMCSLIAQIIRRKVYVLDEIVIRHATTQQACERFCERFPHHAAGVEVYGDASGHQQRTSGSSDYDIVREALGKCCNSQVEYRLDRQNPLVRERVNLTNSVLRNAAGEVGLWVDRKCKELIKDFEQVSYKTDGTEVDKDSDRERTHASDALGYLLWQQFHAKGEIGERGYPLVGIG